MIAANMPNWLPLEDNLVALNGLLRNWGVLPQYRFMHIFLKQTTALQSAIKALIFWYNEYENVRAHRAGDQESESMEHPNNLFFMRQSVPNTSGTIAMIHTMLNIPAITQYNVSFLKQFFDASKDMTPEQRCELLESDWEYAAAQNSAARLDCTITPIVNDNLNYHFIVFINHNGRLFELDGRKHGPVEHGKTTLENFVPDAREVFGKYVSDSRLIDRRYAVLVNEEEFHSK